MSRLEPFDLRGKDEDAQARLINQYLQLFYSVLQKNQRVADKVTYSIKARGELDQKRRDKHKEFDGPDENTADILSRNKEGWTENPLSFWQDQHDPDLVGLYGEAAIVAHYIKIIGDHMDQMERSAKKSGISIEQIASVLSSRNSSIFPCQYVMKTAKRMLDQGSQYLHLEKEFGRGLTFVLGTKLSKTFYTKIVGKSGKNFQEIKKAFEAQRIRGMARAYESLRNDVIRVKMQSLGLELPHDLLPSGQPHSMMTMSMADMTIPVSQYHYYPDSTMMTPGSNMTFSASQYEYSPLTGSSSGISYSVSGRDQYDQSMGFESPTIWDFDS